MAGKKCHNAQDFTMSLSCAKLCAYARKNGLRFNGGEVVAHHSIRPRVEVLISEGTFYEGKLFNALKGMMAVPVLEDKHCASARLRVGKAVPTWWLGHKVPAHRPT